MDSLRVKLEEMLESPEKSEQLRDLLSSMEEKKSPEMDYLKKLGSLYPNISETADNDETITLLKALKPFIREENQARLEKSIRLIQLLRLMPMIKGGSNKISERNEA